MEEARRASLDYLDYLDYLETSEHEAEELSNHAYLALYCGKCGYKHKVKVRCGSRVCGECRDRDFWRLYLGYRKAVQAMKKPKLLTLTLVNKPELSQDEVKRLRECFKRLLRRKYYKARVQGGLYAIEAIEKGKGWHIHLHALIDAEYLEQEQIVCDWKEITGDSFICDVRKAYSPKAGLKYILKYLTKPPQVNGKEMDYNSVMRGIRLVQPFGTLYHALTLEKHTPVCPVCGSRSWIVEWDLRGMGEIAVEGGELNGGL